MSTKSRHLYAAVVGSAAIILSSPALGTEFAYCTFDSPRGRDVVHITDVFLVTGRYPGNLERKLAFRGAMEARGHKVGKIFCFENPSMSASQAMRREGVANEKKFGARVIDVN